MKIATQDERMIFEAQNLYRTQPRLIQRELEAAAKDYQWVTGGDWIKEQNTADSDGTKLGRDAIETAISYIKEQSSVQALDWSDGLALTAKKLCLTLSNLPEVHDEQKNSFSQDFGKGSGA